MYYPQMIQAGMIYKAIPPLFSIPAPGKGKNRYFTENIDMVRYNQKNFLDLHSLAYKGNDLTGKEVTSFFLKNADYLYYMNNVADTYSIEHKLLEIMLINYVENGKFVAKKIEKEIRKYPMYRFINIEEKDGNIILRGDSTKSQFAVAGDRLLHDSRFIIDILKSNVSCRYTMDKKEASIYDIMSTYKSTEPAKVQRYKGLGEMDFRNLAESALDPDKDRTLIRYTMQDVKEEIEAIREYESNTKKILTLAGTITRDDLIE